MKWTSLIALATALISPGLFAMETVTFSGPVPPVAQFYATSGSETLVYTITNNVPKTLPMTVSGISAPLSRIPVANDCGNTLPAGPATCNIGIQIAANTLGTINQTLKINYEGRTSLSAPISFSVVEPYAYVTPSPNASSILRYLLDTITGAFTTESTAYTSLTQSFDALTFATVGGVQYAYVLDQNGFVYQCTILADGTFDPCISTPPGPSIGWGPHGIAFATVNGVQYAYVSEVNNSVVYQCSLNSDGSFNACAQASATFTAPYGIAFETTNGVQYAYVADAGAGGGSPGSVFQCPLNSDGSLGTCSPIPVASPPAWFPYTVTFTSVNGTRYAYVADNGSGVPPSGPPPGNVYRCTLLNDGSFNTCDPTPAVGAPSSNWFPSDIAFATLNGNQYAYVANYQGPIAGGMDWCTLNIDGTFTNSGCNSTPASPPVGFQPVGIAFRF